jgi:hypothetical protein
VRRAQRALRHLQVQPGEVLTGQVVGDVARRQPQVAFSDLHLQSPVFGLGADQPAFGCNVLVWRSCCARRHRPRHSLTRDKTGTVTTGQIAMGYMLILML